MQEPPVPTSPPADTPRLYALVPCAGRGERAGANGLKQYAVIAGRSVVAHTLAALSGVQRITDTLVVVASSDTEFERHVPGYSGWVARCGGATRALSVVNGLDELQSRGAGAEDWVLVHDAARCLLRPEWVDDLIDACISDKVGGLLAMPLADTLKAARGSRVASTLQRSDKWVAQTPQMFRLGRLRGALRRAGPEPGDEAAAMETAGHSPLLVPGSLENFKLTWPSDFELAERLLRSRAQ